MLRVVLLAVLLLWSQPLAAQTAKLRALGADPAKVSTSGLSSGAFMAVQYGVAFSASIMGVGVVAGGPYGCAQLASISTCMHGAPSGAASYQKARENDQKHLIDSVDHLRTQRVYLFSGQNDGTVVRSVVDATRDFYLAAGTPAANMQYVKDVPAGHAFIAADFGNACGASQPPYVDQCVDHGAPYDQPKEILTQIYGPMQPRAATLSAAPTAFDQTEFIGDFDRSGLARTGYVYVPTTCASGGGCAVHVVFHGCQQNADKVDDAVYGHVGYNAWADTNRIIVLYPQVGVSALAANPMMCWDWWGETPWLWWSYAYTGPQFATRTGFQLSTVQGMVQRLVAQPLPHP